MSEENAVEQYDVIIIGAGISGIGAACHLQRECPGKRYVILEARVVPKLSVTRDTTIHRRAV